MPQYAPVFDLATLDGSDGFRLDGVAAGDYAGWRLSGIGDVNGDGLDDFAVSAPPTDPGGVIDAGSVYVIFGSTAPRAAVLDLGSLDGEDGFRVDGVTANGMMGFSLDGGDFNGDGFSDLLVKGGGVTGVGYVIFGRAEAFGVSLDPTTLDGADGFQITNLDATVYGARWVANAGDVNGDGVDDIVVGSPGAIADYAGQAYVVFGGASAGAASIDVSELDGSNGFSMGGAAVDSRLGFSVDGAGDINGDGFDDVVVGTFATETYIVFGTAGGFAASIDLTALDGTGGFRVSGGDGTGYSVDSAGDINGDGLADAVIAARFAGPNYTGQVYVVFGATGGWGPTLDATTLDGSNGFRIDRAPDGGALGRAVAAGDINGDGFDDVLVGDDAADPGGDSQAGATYVVFGAAAGWGATIGVATLNGDNGFLLGGVDAGDLSGRSVSSADVNGDGIADVLIGARRGDPNGNVDAGEAYVVYGSRPGEAVVRTGTGIANTIFGSAFADTLSGLGGNDTLDGGAGNDTLNGGGGSDTARYAGAAAGVTITLGAGADLDGDGGTDTLRFIENVVGSGFNDTILGSGAANTLEGGFGDDVLNGLGGADIVSGGDGGDEITGNLGQDSLSGGLGDDVIRGGSAGDAIDGGEGVDTATYSASTVRVNINLGAGLFAGGEAAGDLLTSIENLIGSAFNDIMTGDNGANTFNGGAGDDTLNGAGGADALSGASGADTLDGGTGADDLQGGAGDDTLNGGAESDALAGGAGLDVFVFNAALGVSNVDTIADFSLPNDTIQLENAIFTGLAAGALAASRFVIGAAATAATHRIVYDSTLGALYFDADGSGAGAPVQFAALNVGLALTAADFVVI